MAEWMSIQQNNTQYCVNQRTVITNATLLFNEGNDGFASKPTLLEALKRTLQEMPGTDRWYGTMPKVCMIVWTMKMTDPEEVIDTEEVEINKIYQKERKKERKKKESAEKEGKERETTPTHEGQGNRLLRRRVRLLPRGTKTPRRTVRRRAMRLLPPELHRGDA
jgi:hypothetical protein